MGGAVSLVGGQGEQCGGTEDTQELCSHCKVVATMGPWPHLPALEPLFLRHGLCVSIFLAAPQGL